MIEKGTARPRHDAAAVSHHRPPTAPPASGRPRFDSLHPHPTPRHPPPVPLITHRARPRPFLDFAFGCCLYDLMIQAPFPLPPPFPWPRTAQTGKQEEGRGVIHWGDATPLSSRPPCYVQTDFLLPFPTPSPMYIPAARTDQREPPRKQARISSLPCPHPSQRPKSGSSAWPCRSRSRSLSSSTRK